MNPITRLWCVVAAIWLITASAGRIVIQLVNNLALDALPFISTTVGLVGLMLLFLEATDRGKANRND